MMKTYYNEFDKKKCAALKQLMTDGYISKGEIDDRPIQEVMPNDLQGYDRCHFFAGIGLWDYALDLAGWSEDVRVWTGSCPCQPFSTAGRQKGKIDDRHLWPQWLRLIEECKPTVVFGEQVAAAVTQGWLDDVYQGLEAQDYAVGSVILPASAVGAPHRRERLWFVGDSRCVTERDEVVRLGTEREYCDSERVGTETRYGFTDTSTMGDSKLHGRSTAEVSGSNAPSIQHHTQRSDSTCELTGASNPCAVADSDSEGSQRCGGYEQQYGEEGREVEERHHWSSGVWINCPDGKQRLVEPTIPLLADGFSERVGVIHCAGDAIVPQVAAEFIKAFINKDETP